MKTLLMPFSFGLLAVGSALFAGLSYVNIWLVMVTLVADAVIIWFICVMSRSIGAIKAYESD